MQKNAPFLRRSLPSPLHLPLNQHRPYLSIRANCSLESELRSRSASRPQSDHGCECSCICQSPFGGCRRMHPFFVEVSLRHCPCRRTSIGRICPF